MILLMKPNHKQIEIAQMLKSIIGSWITTNDITSPTHGSDQYHELMKLVDYEILTEDQVNVIEDNLIDILNCIRTVK